MTQPNEPQVDALKEQMEQKKAEEHQERVDHAMARARAMSTLMLGEEIIIQETKTTIMAVPGGWIFFREFKAGLTSTFVPQPQTNTPPAIKKPEIVLPNG